LVAHDADPAGREDLLADAVPGRLRHGVLYAGMELVFWLFFSGLVISDARKFGPIGIIFALLSYLIAIGVVVILGAAVGLAWQERGLSVTAVLRNCGERSDRWHQRGAPRPA
jgi:membrane protein